MKFSKTDLCSVGALLLSLTLSACGSGGSPTSGTQGGSTPQGNTGGSGAPLKASVPGTPGPTPTHSQPPACDDDLVADYEALHDDLSNSRTLKDFTSLKARAYTFLNTYAGTFCTYSGKQGTFEIDVNRDLITLIQQINKTLRKLKKLDQQDQDNEKQHKKDLQKTLKKGADKLAQGVKDIQDLGTENKAKDKELKQDRLKNYRINLAKLKAEKNEFPKKRAELEAQGHDAAIIDTILKSSEESLDALIAGFEKNIADQEADLE